MGIHQVFSQNLRTSCLKFSSIAEACRFIGLNRQQFNKYLSGAMLPNARTLHRICGSLGVEEWTLFVPQEAQSALAPKPVDAFQVAQSHGAAALFENKILAKLLASNKDVGIMPGVYTSYFPLQGVAGCMVASTVWISKHQGLVTFTRHTRIHSPSSKNHVLAKGKHHGIVLSNGTYDYLIGYNMVSPNNITFNCFPRDVTGGNGILIGLAVIQGMTPLVACRVALKRLGSSLQHIKQALKENANLHFAKTDYEMSLLRTLNSPGESDGAVLTLFDLNKLMLGTNPNNRSYESA